jgi:AcrR family transcriptional regulator
MSGVGKTPREQALSTAGRLFYREGFHAVGIDRIVEESGVSKMTLYRHFPSKDDLITAVLQENDERFWGWFDAATGDVRRAAVSRLLGIFQALQDLVTKPSCHGCPFLLAASEFQQKSHPAHRHALDHKRRVRARLLDLSREAGAAQPERLADGLLLLLDGALMAPRVFGAENPAAHVLETARVLIEALSAGRPQDVGGPIDPPTSCPA